MYLNIFQRPFAAVGAAQSWRVCAEIKRRKERSGSFHEQPDRGQCAGVYVHPEAVLGRKGLEFCIFVFRSFCVGLHAKSSTWLRRPPGSKALKQFAISLHFMAREMPLARLKLAKKVKMQRPMVPTTRTNTSLPGSFPISGTG